MAEYDSQAEKAANDWLALVDAGNAPASWATAASLFKRAVSQDQWARSLDAARGPLGPLVSRKLKDGTPAKELPGAPDGDYVIFQFDAQFERKRSAIETVTPMRDADGSWRAYGYYIKCTSPS